LTAAVLAGIGLATTVAGIFAYEQPPWVFMSGTVSGPGFIGYPSIRLTGSEDSFNIYNSDNEFRPPLPDLSVGDRVELYLTPDPYHISGGDYTVIAVRKDGQLYASPNYEAALAYGSSANYQFRAVSSAIAIPLGLGLLVFSCALGAVWARMRRRLSVALCLGGAGASLAPALLQFALAAENFDVLALLGFWPYAVWPPAALLGLIAGIVSVSRSDLPARARAAAGVAMVVIGVTSLVWVISLIWLVVSGLSALGA
jgi:hypothetical protein